MSKHPSTYYLNGLSKITKEIVKKTSGGNYIYRGEPECYEKIASTLYRKYEWPDPERYNIASAEKNILKEVKNYPNEREREDIEIFADLQHYGSDTNLIDFTTDYFIALFFACHGSYYKTGRIVLLEMTEKMTEKYQIEKPQQPQNRVMAQKSVFVRPSEGFVDCGDVNTICIPKHLKQWILIHLRNYHDISIQTIYNDLHGYIRQKTLRSSPDVWKPFILQEMLLKRMDESFSPEGQQNNLEKMIKAYTTRMQYEPYNAILYMEQGAYYKQKKEYDRAIETFSKAILLVPNYVQPYINRGIAYSAKHNFECAIEDFTQVIDLNPDSSKGYVLRGTAYSLQGKNDLALENYNRALEVNADDSQAHEMRALLQAHQREKMDFDMSHLSEKAEYLLRQAVADLGKRIEHSDLAQGIIISTNGKDIIQEHMTRNNISRDQRETVEAEWELALRTLVYEGFLEQSGGVYPLIVYKVTEQGIRFSRQNWNEP